jgi:hypothetical protein
MQWLINIKDRKLNSPIIAYPIQNQQFQLTSKRKENKVLGSINSLAGGSLSLKTSKKDPILQLLISRRYSIASQLTSQRRLVPTCTKLLKLDAILVIAKMLSNLTNAQYFEQQII